MSFKVIEKKDVTFFVASLTREMEVVGPVAKDGKFVFSPIKDYSQLRLDCNITLLSPKEYFLPQQGTSLEE